MYLCNFKTEQMGLFEGYVGIRLWDGQQMDDIIFAMLLVLFISFAVVFRSNFRLFLKMLKDAVFIKERHSLFESSAGTEWLFRNFMIFQALFLCSIAAFAYDRIRGNLQNMGEKEMFMTIGLFFTVLLLFYQFKRCCFSLLGYVFADPARYRFWKTNYNAIIGTWGVLLYIPVLWLIFVGSHVMIPIMVFVFLYILCRIVIIYKTIRIFHRKNTGLLYISLYLCSQEILPLVFLYEGMVHLYNFIETSTLWH